VKRIIAATRYFALIGVIFGLLAALAAFGWGASKTISVVVKLVQGQTAGTAVALVQIMDGFLIAAGLLIFGLGLYELFIGELDLPDWLTIKNLDALKSKLAGIVMMVMVVSFLEMLETHDQPRDILFTGVAVALVSAPLIALGWKKGSG
jgi:uncharacterized membrane protein YqhA